MCQEPTPSFFIIIWVTGNDDGQSSSQVNDGILATWSIIGYRDRDHQTEIETDKDVQRDSEDKNNI